MGLIPFFWESLDNVWGGGYTRDLVAKRNNKGLRDKPSKAKIAEKKLKVNFKLTLDNIARWCKITPSQQTSVTARKRGP